MNTKKIIPILAMVFVLSIGFAQATVPDTNVAVISGKITDADNNPVSGATVTATCQTAPGIGNTASTTSNANGFYVIVLDCPMDGTVKVEASKDASSGSNTGSIDQINQGYTCDSCGVVNIGIACIDVSIPEFATMALPVALSVVSFGIISTVKKRRE